MSMRRYVAVRAAWQVGALFSCVSLAYAVAYVLPREHLGGDPGYGGFLWALARGSLGSSAGPSGTGPRSVAGMTVDAAGVTLSLVLLSAVFAVSLGAVLALATARTRFGRVTRAVGYGLASLLPIWAGFYLAFYVGFEWGITRVGGYCPLHATRGFACHGLGPWLGSLLLPSLTLSISFAAIYARWIVAARRRAAAEVSAAEGAEPSEAPRRVRRRHGLLFAKLLSRDFALALGFAAFVETIFSLPGLGRMTVFAASFGGGGGAPNAPLLAGVLVTASILTAVASFLVDVACAAAEPSLRRF